MEELKEELQKSIREVPKFDKLENHIDMTVTNEGLRIELTESAAGTFFDSGSARMSGDGSMNSAGFPIISPSRGPPIPSPIRRPLAIPTGNSPPTAPMRRAA